MSKVVTVRVSDDEYLFLKGLSEKEKRSVGYFVRGFIADGMVGRVGSPPEVGVSPIEEPSFVAAQGMKTALAKLEVDGLVAETLAKKAERLKKKSNASWKPPKGLSKEHQARGGKKR